MKTYNKLVRDKIPEIIKKQGQVPKTRQLDDSEYFEALNHKLTEEVAEYFEDYDIEELADIMEVIYALVKYKGLSVDEFEKVRRKKFDERGGFNDRVLLVEVE